MSAYDTLLLKAIVAAVNAGQAIKAIYDTDFDIAFKADDSPLTAADKRSHDIITQSLMAGGDIPVLSEEGRETAFINRRQWEQLWIVDPLDGTKEFVKRNGEFTVNIALVERKKPVLGVVYAPVPDVLYFAHEGIGAYKTGASFQTIKAFEDGQKQRECLQMILRQSERLPCTQSSGGVYTIVGSRSHATSDLLAFVERKKQEKERVRFVQAGSSLKICLVAEGAADIYPRLGPTMEWDTAAGQAVAACSGAMVYEYGTKQTLSYNKADLLNPWFIVER